MADGTRLKTLSNKLDDVLTQMSLFSTQMTDLHTHISYLEAHPLTPPSHHPVSIPVPLPLLNAIF